MHVIKKIILTVVLIVCLLFIQSYLFSDTCTLNPNDPSLKTIGVGCSSEECNFFLFKEADLSPEFNICMAECNSSFFEDNYQCAQDCVNDYLTTTTDILKTNNLDFTKSNCGDKKTNVILGSNINFEMKNATTSLSISGIDSLNTNGKDIDIFVNNNNKLGNATFTFDFNNLIVSNTSKITMRTKERTSVPNSVDRGWTDWVRDGVIFDFNNIEVRASSSLDLNIYVPKNILNVNDNLALQQINSYLAGGEVSFKGNKIVNNGTLNLYLKAQDSQDGKNYVSEGNCFNDPQSQGGSVKEAGHVYFYVNFIENTGNFSSQIFAGNGGVGGKGSRAQRGCSNDPPGHGGHGGHGGNIFLYFENIINLNNLDFNLVSGNGGPGGDTGFDGMGFSPNPNFAIGGNGGNGGNIYFCKSIWNSGFQCVSQSYNSLINNGVLTLNAITGKGSNGGNKTNQPATGRAGNGGNGGSFISDLKIDFLNNNGVFNINLKSNIYGVKGTTPGGANGVSGSTKNFIVSYLLNLNDNFNVIIDSKKNVSLDESDIIINRIQTGSYLPKKLHTLSNEGQVYYDPNCENNCNNNFENCCPGGNCQEDQLDNCISQLDACINSCIDFENTYNLSNRKIKINNACYVKQPSIALDYMTESIEIKSANNNDFSSFLPSDAVLTTNTECSICDYYDFESNEVMPTGTANKFSQTYTLYSSKQGAIPANNLKIYYAKNNSTFTKINSLYNPFTKEDNLPLYTNKVPITGVLNEKLNLYEYKINLNNLEWYYDKEMDLTGKDIFCYYQNYRIEGSIDGTSFNFPFTPLFKN